MPIYRKLLAGTWTAQHINVLNLLGHRCVEPYQLPIKQRRFFRNTAHILPVWGKILKALNQDEGEERMYERRNSEKLR